MLETSLKLFEAKQRLEDKCIAQPTRAERVALFRVPFRGSTESSVSEFSSIGKCRTIIYYFGIQE